MGRKEEAMRVELPRTSPLWKKLRRAQSARTRESTAHWEPPEKLKDLLTQHDCRYHRAQALDVFRSVGDGSVQVLSAAEVLTPLPLYRVDHGDPSFMKRGGR